MTVVHCKDLRVTFVLYAASVPALSVASGPDATTYAGCTVCILEKVQWKDECPFFFVATNWFGVNGGVHQ